MSRTLYKMTAFAKDPSCGNPAGVVFDADAMSEIEMLEIAKDVGYSETAFVMQSDKADFRVRFFTPVEEVDLCGHATIATFNLMRDTGRIGLGQYIQETKAGVLKIRVEKDRIFMEQNIPQYYEFIDKVEIQDCFGIGKEACSDQLPIQIVSTGLKDIILPIGDVDSLNHLQPNFEKIKALSIKYGVIGIHAFCLRKRGKFEIYARNFAPLYGIDEEAATGTANGALGCYLMKHMKGAFDGDFVINQGYSMGRPSKIVVEIQSEDCGITAVYVGGRSAVIE